MNGVVKNKRGYRFVLQRTVSPLAGGTVLFIMLNPSTADDEIDDPTIRRCKGFAERWGFSRLLVGNLFAARATDPKDLKRLSDPVGLHNDFALRQLAAESDRVVCAWGVHGTLHGRDAEVKRLLPQWHDEIYCLGRTKEGHPRHPLFVKADTPLEEFYV